MLGGRPEQPLLGVGELEPQVILGEPDVPV